MKLGLGVRWLRREPGLKLVDFEGGVNESVPHVKRRGKKKGPVFMNR